MGCNHLFFAVSKATKRFIKDDKSRRKFYVAVLPDFMRDEGWDKDWDISGDDPILDAVMKELEPSEEEDENES